MLLVGVHSCDPGSPVDTLMPWSLQRHSIGSNSLVDGSIEPPTITIFSGVTSMTVFCVGAFGNICAVVSCFTDTLSTVPANVLDLLNLRFPVPVKNVCLTRADAVCAVTIVVLPIATVSVPADAVISNSKRKYADEFIVIEVSKSDAEPADAVATPPEISQPVPLVQPVVVAMSPVVTSSVASKNGAHS